MILDQYGKPYSVRNESSTYSKPAQWLIDALTDGRENPSGVKVNESVVMSITAAYACVRNIAQDLGKMPLMVFQNVDGEKNKLRDSDLYYMLHDRPDPTEYKSAARFRQDVTADCALGNGYAFIRRNGMRQPVGLRWISRHRVKPIRQDDDSLAYEVRKPNGEVEDTISAANMLHLPGFGIGDMGWNIVWLFARAFGLTVAQENNQAAFFGNGSTIGGMLKHPGVLSEEAANRLVENFERRTQGSNNSFKTVLLEDQLDWVPNSATNQDSQAKELREFQLAEICRVWRMPPHKIQDLSRAHFANIEQQNIEYVQDCLMYYVVMWEQEIKMKLVSPNDRETFAEHSLTAMLRGDNQARATFYKTMFEIGVLSQNDIRALENQNGIGEAGDTYYVPANNLVPSDIASKGPQPKQLPAPAPEPAKEPAKPATPPTDRVNRILKNHARMLGNELARHGRFEQDQLKRATNQGKSPSQWASSFYEGHQRHLENAIRPIVQSWYDSIHDVGRN